MVTAPSEKDFRDPKLGVYIEKYFRGVNNVSTENRLRIMRLIENLSLRSAAVGYRTESMHGAVSSGTEDYDRKTKQSEDEKENGKRNR